MEAFPVALRIVAVLIPVLLSGACRPPDPEPDPIKPSGDDTDLPGHEDHTDDSDVVALPDTRRPLCLVDAAPPPVASDLLAWVAGVYASDEKLYGQRRADELEAMGETGLGTRAPQIVSNRIERGWNRLRLNDIDGALTDLQIAADLAAAEVPASRYRARQILASAWMRKAELDNCVADGTGGACLVPFDAQSHHDHVEGMTNACTVLEDILSEDDPDNLVQRWLLNLGHMALGDYPAAVPSEWLVPPSVLASEEVMPAWTNVAPMLAATQEGPGVAFTLPSIAGSSSMNDFDGDGLVDLMSSSTDPEVGLWLFLNQGDGRFCDASDASGLSASVQHLDFFPADYDNDGDLDVLGTRGAWMDEGGYVRPSLLNNDGTGRFTDVTLTAGITNIIGPGQAAAWADVDGDGWLDFFLGRERGLDEIPDSSLYINQRDGTFTDRARPAGVNAPGYVKGAAFGDYDNDGDQDLYVSIFNGPNRLYRNKGDGKFDDVTEEQGVQDPRYGFAPWFFDYDQDGDLDLFAAAYANLYGGKSPLDEEYGKSAEGFITDLLGLPNDDNTAHLYRNDGGQFVDVTVAMGLDDVHNTMGANFGDFDMDGWPDIYLGTGGQAYDAIEPNVAYHNAGGQRFNDVTSSTHMGHIQKGHGVAFADLDEDGDEDIMADIGGAYIGDRFPNALFQNPSEGRHAIHLRLEGVSGNRMALGARVRVVTPMRTFHHVVGMGGSFGASSLQVEAALGDDSTISRVEIDWPVGSTEVIDGLSPDMIVWIREGEGVVDSRPFAPFVLGDPEAFHEGHE